MTETEKRMRKALRFCRTLISEELSCRMNSFCGYDPETELFTDESVCEPAMKHDIDECRKALKLINEAFET